MVFPGRFSTGCLRCRQRKVKCDEGKPSCRRCYIYGKECPGYTDQFHFRHGVTPSNYEKPGNKSPPKGQNARLNQHRRKSSAASRATQTPKVKDKDEQKQTLSTSPTEITWSIKPAPSPKVSYDDVSLCYFVRRFVSPDSTDGLPGHLTFLPGMYDHYGSSVLELATQSVAKMAAYNAFGGEEFRLQSYQTYGRAIKSLQDTIQDDQQATDDKTLASILLLCTMKDISGEGVGDPSEHAPGLYYLLERRGMEQLATRRGVELFLLALIRLQVYSFLREDDIYSDPGGMATILGAWDPLIRAMSMMSRTLSLRHQLSKYVPFPDMLRAPGAVSAPPPPYANQDEEGHELAIQSCLELLGEFDSWDSEAASYWQSMFEGRALPTALGEVGGRMSYCDPQTACTIVLVRSARLIMLLSILTYHASMQLADENGPGLVGDTATWATWIPTLQADVHKTIDDILACVPFCLGDLDPEGQPSTMAYDGAGAIMIHQPLRLVTFCAYARPDQVASAQKTLHRINGGIGIRSAVGYEGIQVQMEALNVQGSPIVGGDGCASEGSATAAANAVGLGIL